MNNFFKLTYVDGDTFTGQLLKGNDWVRSPEKKIVKLEYVLGNKKLTFEGFKQYVQVYEQVVFQSYGITQALVIGRTENYSLIFTFNFKTKQVTREKVMIGQEYRGMILSGWKEGELTIPKYRLEGRNV